METIQATERLYFRNSRLYQCTATIVSASLSHLTLDKTIFHPAGGGQPSDSGTISYRDSTFKVESLEDDGNVIKHIGSWTGIESAEEVPSPGMIVDARIDAKLRDRSIGMLQTY